MSAASVRLFISSVLALYLELVAIRWLGAEVRMFAYLKNMALLGAFLGLGLGMLRSGRPLRSHRLPILLAVFALLLIFSPQLQLTRLFFPDPAVYHWGGSIGSPAFVSVARSSSVGALLQWAPDAAVPWILGIAALLAAAALLALLVAIFYECGHLVGALLTRVAPPLTSYTIHLAGGLAGVLLFGVVVYFEQPPAVWLAPAIVAIVLLSTHRMRDGIVLGALLVVVYGIGGRNEVLWSPYYRLSYSSTSATTHTLSVDHDYYQDAFDLRPPAVQASGGLAAAARYYNLPFRIAPSCGRVLILGAGLGNDVAAAVRAGCGHIDAVEIDPTIGRLGRALHPEAPYASPRVNVVIDDARAYLRRARTSGQVYDLIVFGLVDSQAALSTMSSLRLEFFVYSVESFRDAIGLLDHDRGLIVLGFSIGWKDWVRQRIHKTLEAAAQAPSVVVRPSEYLRAESFITGPGLPQTHAALQEYQTVPHGDASEWSSIRVVTDDWPFLYHDPARLPWVYIGSLLCFLVASIVLTKTAARGGYDVSGGLDVTMFLMGAAFFLIEVKNISQLALLFGATWIVNVVVFGCVLALAIAANMLVARTSRVPLAALFAGLVASLLVSFFVPFSYVAALSPLGRSLVGGGIAAAPVFFSTLIFARLFRRTEQANAALASNILGGVTGGALEALSIFTGIRAMALVAVLIYLGAAYFALSETSEAGTAIPVPGSAPV